MEKYYNLNKILSKKDINGNKPELYLITSNRSAGKTTALYKYFIKKYLKNNEKFILYGRYSTDLMGIFDDFYKKTSLFYKLNMSYTKKAKGKYITINNNNKPIGYILSINASSTIRQFSETFTDVQRIGFDEFQSESMQYVPNEIIKFISLHMTIARGFNQNSRYVPVFLTGNPYDLLNPYYRHLGISGRLQSDTKFLRGAGWVLEQYHNIESENNLKNSGFNQAMKSDYMDYAIMGKYLNNMCLIKKLNTKSQYICTIIINNNKYGVRIFGDEIYISNKPDPSCKLIYNNDIYNLNNGLFLNKQSDIYYILYNSLLNGQLYFDNLETKTEIFNII